MSFVPTWCTRWLCSYWWHWQVLWATSACAFEVGASGGARSGGGSVLLLIIIVSTSQSLESDLTLNLLLPVPTGLKKPTKPITQVWVSNGYLKHNLYPSNPYPHTHTGLQTHNMHYLQMCSWKDKQ